MTEEQARAEMDAELLAQLDELNEKIANGFKIL